MMRTWGRVLFFCSAIVTVPGCSADDDIFEDPSVPSTAMAIEEFMSPFAELAMFDGTILIDRNGKIVFEQTYGLASHAFDVRHSPDTRFRIASLSKGITDAALGVLVDRGELTLETKLSAYLPDFPSADQITIGQLVNHQSGIAHTNSQPWGGGDETMSRAELLSRLLAIPLDFEPGTDRSYSNGGYAVLAHVISLVTGTTFELALEELVFAPLEMTNTGDITNSRDIIDHMAVGYEPGPIAGNRRAPRPYAVEMRPGGGSLYSTARDLRRFYRALIDDRLLSHETRKALFGDGDLYEATGRSPGFSAQVQINFDSNELIIVLANNYAFPQFLAEELDRLSKGKSKGWTPLKIEEGPVSETHPMIGSYAWPEFIGAKGEIHLTDKGGLAFTDKENDYSSALIPLADGGVLFTMYFFYCNFSDDQSKDINCSPISGNVERSLLMTRL